MAAVGGEKQALLGPQPRIMSYGGTDTSLAPNQAQTQVTSEAILARAIQILAASQAATSSQQTASPIAATALPTVPLQGSVQNPIEAPSADLARVMKDALGQMTGSLPTASAKPKAATLPVVAAQQTLKLKQGLYEGDVLDNLPHGRGTLTWHPGMQQKKYEGEWKKSEPHGRGVLRFTNGDKFEGQWENGLLHGQVVITCANGQRYEGGYANGKKHGRGSFRDIDGNTYVGDWIDGKRYGQGKYTRYNGDYYEGGWKNDKRHGHGEEVVSGDYSYSGEWENDKQHGRGSMKCGGSFFEGTFRNGEKWTGRSLSGPYTFSYENGVQQCSFCSNCSIL